MAGQTTIHYQARYAAEGGPGVSLDTINVDPFDNAPMQLVIMPEGNDYRFAVTDGQGQVHATSNSARELALWMVDYATALDGMVTRGDL